MPAITPFLWFDNQAEEAMNYYISIFKNGRVLNVYRRDGKVLTVEFELNGQRIMALNGGPLFNFTEAISLFVSCDTQEEVDELWEKLTAGGEESQCGWLKDKYGLWWQIIPKALLELLSDPGKSQAVFETMMKMKKIVIHDLKQAYEGKAAA